MRPALTPSEWEDGETTYPVATLETTRGGKLHVSSFEQLGDLDGFVVVREDHRHAVAALALHQQPYGFTRDDIDLLNAFIRELAAVGSHDNSYKLRATDLRDRIEALLPPAEHAPSGRE